MKEVEFNLFSKNDEELLNRIYYNLIDMMRASSETAVFYDLKDKYDREMQLVRSNGGAANIVNDTYKKLQNFNSRHFKMAELLQRTEKLDIVGRLYSEEEFNVGNFKWKVLIQDNSDYDSILLLANSLESFDEFIVAIEKGIIKINTTIKIHNDIPFNVDDFNADLLDKLKQNMISFFKNDIFFEMLSDEQITDALINYACISDGENPFYDDYMEEETAFQTINIYNYIVNEYVYELKSIVFRLFAVYEYFKENEIDIENLNNETYRILHSAIHYYNLEDSYDSVKKDDDYATEYDSLSIFYKILIHNLGTVLYTSVDDVKNKEEKKEEPAKILSADKINNFDNLTHKLILELKKKKKQ